MAKNIGVIFEVLGEGDISGESGKRIAGQLNSIATAISKKPPKVKFQLDTAETKKLMITQLQELVSGLKIGNKGLELFGNSIAIGGAFNKEIENVRSKVLTISRDLNSNIGTFDTKKFLNLDTAGIEQYSNMVSELRGKIVALEHDSNGNIIANENNYNSMQEILSLYDSIKTKVGDIRNAEGKLNSAQKEQNKDLKETISLLEVNGKAYKELLSGKYALGTGLGKEVLDLLQGNEKEKIPGLWNDELFNKFINGTKLSENEMQQLTEKIEDFRVKYEQLVSETKGKTILGDNNVKNNKVLIQAEELLRKIGRAGNGASETAKELMNLINGIKNGTISPKEGFSMFKGLQEEAEGSGKVITNVFTKVTDVIKNKFGYGLAAAVAMYMRRMIRQLYRNVVEIDSALAQLEIVTGKSGYELEKALKKQQNRLVL